MLTVMCLCWPSAYRNQRHRRIEDAKNCAYSLISSVLLMPPLFHDGAEFPRLTSDCDPLITPSITYVRLTTSNERNGVRHMRLAVLQEALPRL